MKFDDFQHFQLSHGSLTCLMRMRAGPPTVAFSCRDFPRSSIHTTTPETKRRKGWPLGFLQPLRCGMTLAALAAQCRPYSWHLQKLSVSPRCSQPRCAMSNVLKAGLSVGILPSGLSLSMVALKWHM